MPDAVRVASAHLAVTLGPRRRCGLDRTLDDDGLRRTTEALWRWRWQFVDGDDDGDDFLGHVDSLEFRFVSVYCSRSAAGCQAQIAASVMVTKAVTHTAMAIQLGIRSATLRSEIRLWWCAVAIVFLMFFIRLLYHIYRHFVNPAATESGASLSFYQSFLRRKSLSHKDLWSVGQLNRPAQRVSPAASGGIRCYKSRADKGFRGWGFSISRAAITKEDYIAGWFKRNKLPTPEMSTFILQQLPCCLSLQIPLPLFFSIPILCLILRTAPSVTGRPLRWVNSAASSLSFRMPAFSRIYWRSFSDHFLFIMSCSVYNKVVICTIIL